MEETELIKIELAFQGICIQEGRCVSLRDKELHECNIREQVEKLSHSIKANKRMIRDMWDELTSFVAEPQMAVAEGGESTQKMFINAVHLLLIMCYRFPSLMASKPLIYKVLCADVSKFGELFMSRVIEFAMALDWTHHLVRLDMYRIRLLNGLIHKDGIKVADGSYGIFPLPNRERVWPASEDEDDLDDAKSSPSYDFWHRRNLLGDKYNSSGFEEGFVFREMRNDPYDIDDDEDNPYPHRNLLYQA